MPGVSAGGSTIGSTVETGEITDAAVTAAKLATDAVETAKIKDANVTAAKLSITPLRLLASSTLGAAAASVVFTSLSGDFFEFKIKAGITTGAALVYCYLNANETATNYYNQKVSVETSTLTASRVNAPEIGEVSASDGALITGTIARDADGFGKALSRCTYENGSGIYYWDHAMSSSADLGAALTTIKFAASASTFTAGSVFEVWGH